jgi:hypothetical protein
MRSARESTWWKRLFTVLEVTVALIAILLSAVIYFSETDYSKPPIWKILLFVTITVGIVRLIRIAVTYVVEGGKHRD